MNIHGLHRYGIVAAMLVSACNAQTESSRAIEELRMIEASSLPSKADKCAAYSKIAKAYLKERNQDMYDTWSVIEQVQCR